MKSRFPGRGDPEPCHIRGPLLCEGFMEPWGAAAAASAPKGSAPPSVYREKRGAADSV